MPKYTFSCPMCSTSLQQNVSRDTSEIACVNCQKQDLANVKMKRQMPKLGGQPQVNEVVDKYVNRVWQDGQQESIKVRRDKYYWSVEVPRMVNSGTYSVETMFENNWVYFNEKEELCVHNKPPHER